MRRFFLAWCVVAIVLSFLSVIAHAQTALERGDVAFSGYNAAGPDEFSLVLLTDVAAGTTISFTERGWLATGGFRAGEASFTLTFSSNYPCGTELRAVMSPPAVLDESGASVGTTSGGGIALATTGDQLFAYQGPEPVAGNESGFLAAIQMNGPWDADATSANTSAKPASLTDGLDSLAVVPEVDNARYDCSLVAGESALLSSAVNDASRWRRDDAVPFDLTATCGFTCEAPAATPTPTAQPTASPSPTPAPTPTEAPTPESTATPSPAPTPSPSPDPTPTPSPDPTPDPTATPSPSPSPEPTASPSPKPTPTPTPEPAPTQTPAPTPSPSPTATPTAAPTATPTPEPTQTPTPDPSPTLAATATPPVPVRQSRAQRACIDALNRGLLHVSRAQMTEASRCLSAFSRSRETSAEACIAADDRGYVAKARARLEAAEARSCAQRPNFGPNDAGHVAHAATGTVAAMLADVFGDLDSQIALGRSAGALARCQRSLASEAGRCAKTRLAEFNRCKRRGLAAGSITSADDLGACLAADPRQRVARACDLGMDGDMRVDRIRAELRKTCAGKGVDLAVALPACSTSNDVEAAHACIARSTSCRTCLAIQAADSVAAKCDARDDGTVNGSCVP